MVGLKNTSVAKMILHVESEVDLHGDQEPRAFMLGSQQLQITQIIDRWISPQLSYFKVRANDGCLYILRYDQSIKQWELTLFQAADSS